MVAPGGGMCGFIRGGVCGFIGGCMCGFIRGGHVWFYLGGGHACMVLFGGCAWFYSGVCAWFYSGGCVWFYLGGMHGFIRGGMRGFIRGACVVLFWGGVCGFFSFFGYNEIRSMSGRYASYWNAFLSLHIVTVTDALLADLQSTTSHIANYQQGQVRNFPSFDA